MQQYKKPLKPYLVFSTLLFILGYVVSNWGLSAPGINIIEKYNYITSRDGIDAFLYHFKDYLLMFQPISFAVGGFCFLIGLMAYLYNNDRGIYRIGEEHGSARYATDAEMAKYADKKASNNMIVSKNVSIGLFNKRLPIKYQKNKNTLVIGDSGAAKTLAYILTNILQLNASFIVTDPDGGIVYKVGKLLKKFDYKIKILDLNTLMNSDTFNIFNYIRTELDVDRVLESIIEGTKEADSKNDGDFWSKSEAMLVRSLIAYLWFDGQDNDYTPHLGMVADMLRHLERVNPKVKSPVEQWFDEQNELHPNNYAYKQWTLFNNLYAGETRKSALAIAASRFSVFDHDEVVDLLRHDTMNIDSWNEEKTAVFIAIPETSKAYNFIAAIFLSTIMETLRHKSDDIRLGKRKLEKGKSLLHVRFLIDEFANIGLIPHFKEALATFRKREMSFAIILQSLAQLQEMYKDSWAGIVNNCSTLLFLGGEEEKTTKYLSEREGKQTISLRKQTKSYRGGSGNSSSGSENRDKTGRALLDPSEIGHIDGDECLVYISKEHVYRDKKYYAFDHPNGHLMGDEPGDENWYNYKRYKNEVDELLDKIRPQDLIDHGVIE